MEVQYLQIVHTSEVPSFILSYPSLNVHRCWLAMPLGIGILCWVLACHTIEKKKKVQFAPPPRACMLLTIHKVVPSRIVQTTQIIIYEQLESHNLSLKILYKPCGAFVFCSKHGTGNSKFPASDNPQNTGESGKTCVPHPIYLPESSISMRKHQKTNNAHTGQTS